MTAERSLITLNIKIFLIQCENEFQELLTQNQLFHFIKDICVLESWKNKVL